MKKLKDIIFEKLKLNKKSKSKYNTYTFNLKSNSKVSKLTINLPFEFNFPEINTIVRIDKIAEEIDDFNYSHFNFLMVKDNREYKVVTLSEIGIYNIFIKLINNTNSRDIVRPLIKYINTDNHIKFIDKSLITELLDPDTTIVDIVEKSKMNESIIESENGPKKYSNMILLNQDENAILILRRANYLKKFRTMWGFPGGSIDQKDKDSKAAAVRELKEETGIELTFNEERKCKKFDTIKNEDGSISDYWITTVEDEPKIKLSKEHSKYEWFNEKNEENHKWMPDVFQIIQKIL